MLYKIIIKLDDTQTLPIEVEANNWEEVCDYVFGNIEVVNLDEE